MRTRGIIGALCLLLICCLPLSALGGSVINCLDGGDADSYFAEDAELLEIVYPAIAGADACILRMGDETLMIDAAYDTMAIHGVLPALQAMGISHIDTAFVSHPHDDHMKGFGNLVQAGITFGRMIICHEEQVNGISTSTLRIMRGAGTEIVHMQDGDELELGKAHLTVIQRKRSDFTTNDLSAMLLVSYGECRLLSLGDIENRAQKKVMEEPPACGLQADILKHPHHGYAPISEELLEAIHPELVIVTGVRSEITNATNRLEKHGYPWFRPYPSAIRLRTDGQVWVVDHPDWAEQP